ncbi:PmoA family protein [Desertivirga xinjiangensis]|uniref:DUF6807 domain-containing protein n=1 Tax=Desertivirga xinjiangensis TaxID=539206 RepID=UPI00210DD77F|nr:PmoA family protein [Pedobacter xinjiangensis]
MKTSKLLFFLLCLGNICFAQNPAKIRIVENPIAKEVRVYIDDSLFTSLLYADSLKKHILYPINAAGGTSVTRGYPISPSIGDQVDHPHQIGLWLNYGDVNGADYWNNSTKVDSTKKAYGTIKVKRIENIHSGIGKAELTVLATWYNPGAKAMLEERSKFTFRIQNNARTIERETQLKALTDILFKDNKEGMFGLRVARHLEHPSENPVKVYSDNKGTIKKVASADAVNGSYESSTGIIGEKVFGTRSEWLKLSGNINEKPLSIIIMDHPGNVNYPGFWMARGYGLFAINPLGAEVYTNGKEKLNFSLKTGESTVFRHKLVVGGQLSKSEIAQIYDSFSRN